MVINGNYHDNHSNHRDNYHAEQLLFSCQSANAQKCQVVGLSSCQVVKLSSCQVVKLSGCQIGSLGHAEQLLFTCLCSKVTVYR